MAPCKYEFLRLLNILGRIDTYSKTCVKRPLKKDKSKVLMTTDSLMKV